MRKAEYSVEQSAGGQRVHGMDMGWTQGGQTGHGVDVDWAGHTATGVSQNGAAMVHSV